MPIKLSKTLKKISADSNIASDIREYEERFRKHNPSAPENEQGGSRNINNLYYNLVTDFYEYAWGKSFHFAPRVPGESFKASLARHERSLAQSLELKPGMVVADLGCGIGGPLVEIARYSGARIVGVNSNEYQIKRARKLVKDAGLSHLTDFLHCDFLNVDAPDESFDSVFSIEATACATDKITIYGESFRLLKPGGRFGAYEYCTTDRFDVQDTAQQKIIADLQLGGGLLVMDDQQTVKDALQTVGFEVLETRDLAIQDGPSIPWYEPLAGSGVSLAAFRSSKIGRWATQNTLKLLEMLHIAPKGSVQVAETLNLCADAMVEAGRLGIFTPMYFIHARKPMS